MTDRGSGYRLAGAEIAEIIGPGEPVVVDLSVWRSYAEAWQFAYEHGPEAVRRSHTVATSRVLWWVEPGDVPAADEALRRLHHLRRYGPRPTAFTLRSPAPPPSPPVSARTVSGEGHLQPIGTGEGDLQPNCTAEGCP